MKCPSLVLQTKNVAPSVTQKCNMIRMHIHNKSEYVVSVPCYFLQRNEYQMRLQRRVENKRRSLFLQALFREVFFEIKRPIRGHDIQFPTVTILIRRSQDPVPTSMNIWKEDYSSDTYFVITPLQETTPI